MPELMAGALIADAAVTRDPAESGGIDKALPAGSSTRGASRSCAPPSRRSSWSRPNATRTVTCWAGSWSGPGTR